ncbi:hypothetical protein FSS13T_16270 [Flavobacterium saliperosum S13]|uniref:Uncharacterized protein n=2 Tax=Flavobacterium saliperosum TaxID=329186 RepID=A0A1G4VJ54_9FLAO|nr:hypothetical protein [Flavobacterium saliperosum]ESU25394.1 hypothetical protein FSS13T_16270 [Flavobacterium saliperosum S13]SCX06831.1 hypothetical protein SAMN02927925_01067 [Flavobacterium saliperosum]
MTFKKAAVTFSIISFLYFGTLVFLSTYKIQSVAIDFLRELLTIPFLLGLAVVYIMTLIKWIQMDKFSLKSDYFLAILIFTGTITMLSFAE